MTSSINPLTAPSWMVRQATLLPGVHDLITRSKTTHLAKQKAQMNPRCSSGGLRDCDQGRELQHVTLDGVPDCCEPLWFGTAFVSETWRQAQTSLSGDVLVGWTCGFTEIYVWNILRVFCLSTQSSHAEQGQQGQECSLSSASKCLPLPEALTPPKKRETRIQTLFPFSDKAQQSTKKTGQGRTKFWRFHQKPFSYESQPCLKIKIH